MIEKAVENWHKVIRGEFPGGLDELLAEDVVFYSPVVFTPQKGIEITKLYLSAAANTFGGEPDAASGSPNPNTSKFRYTKQILSGNFAMLEFETEMEGKYVNGVDILTCNDEGKVVEFKVLIRPLQAVNAVHAQMRRMLEKLQETRT